MTLCASSPALSRQFRGGGFSFFLFFSQVYVAAKVTAIPIPASQTALVVRGLVTLVWSGWLRYAPAKDLGVWGLGSGSGSGRVLGGVWGVLEARVFLSALGFLLPGFFGGTKSFFFFLTIDDELFSGAAPPRTTTTTTNHDSFLTSIDFSSVLMVFFFGSYN